MGKCGSIWGVFGPLWFAGKVVEGTCHDISNMNNAQRYKRFVEEHTNKEMELDFVSKIYDISAHDSLWEALEKFKRENPIWCVRHDNSRGSSRYFYDELDWQDVGKRRPQLLPPKYKDENMKKYAYIPKYNASTDSLDYIMRKCLYFNILGMNYEMRCKGVLRMLMEMNGKMVTFKAELEASQLYEPWSC